MQDLLFSAQDQEWERVPCAADRFRNCGSRFAGTVLLPGDAICPYGGKNIKPCHSYAVSEQLLTADWFLREENNTGKQKDWKLVEKVGKEISGSFDKMYIKRA